MARIELEVAHAYGPAPQQESDYALLPMQAVLEDGMAYALLGPSGCGKTTLLNIISGLLQPSQGTVRLDGRDVTQATPQARNIAQVFQFPVVYDTMTVADNLAFALRNRRWSAQQIQARVGQIAEMLELSGQLDQRAAGLSVDTQQKISLGRGLVRPDVSAILLDEPLTVVSPQMKSVLRRQLKQIHQELKPTLIYVTHDQVEALTFAQQVVVMQRGRVVQQGTPTELFERPCHPFVGHFIGSPGMHFLTLQHRAQGLELAQQRLPVPPGYALPQGELRLGVRPEWVRWVQPQAPGALLCTVEQVQDVGTYYLLSASVAGQKLKARLATVTRQGQTLAPGQPVWLEVLGPQTCFYNREEIVPCTL